MNQYITFHKVLDLIEDFQQQSPILNSFGYGNLVDFSRTISGDTQNSPVKYPYLFVVPLTIQYDENTTEYQLSLIFADILTADMMNEKDAVSDMSLECRRFLSYVKRGINTFPELYDNMDLQLPVQAIPFMERMGDHVAGVAIDVNLTVFEDINACDYYPTPTPTASITPTPTITPTNTGTPTPTPTCPVTTQYLEVITFDNTKFRLSLWNDAGFTSVANALCDYQISGTAYGSLGTVYTGVESITSGQHQHTFNLNQVLQPGEVVSSFEVLSYSATTCVCPVDLIFPFIPTPTPTVTQTPTVTPTNTITPTPTQTPNAVCPQSLNVTSSNSGIIDVATYTRSTLLSGTTFDYGYLVRTGSLTGYFVSGTAPDGNNYPIFQFVSGDTNLLFRRFNGSSDEGWFGVEQFPNPLISGVLSGGGAQTNIGSNYTEIAGIRFIKAGTNSGIGTTIYVEYPLICPTPTPSAT
jgi:hypothetical protein